MGHLLFSVYHVSITIICLLSVDIRRSSLGSVGLGESDPVEPIKGEQKTKCGMFAMSQGDMYLIEYVWGIHRDLYHITELGTAGGITSLHLGLMTRMRGGTFTTFDIKDLRCSSAKRAWLDNMVFNMQDLLSSTPNLVAVGAVSKYNQLVLMDNGRKIQEINRYAPFMAKGSVLVTHDWGVEVRQQGFPIFIHPLFISHTS